MPDDKEADGPPDPGNRAVDFRGEKRSNATHRSATDPDCRFVSKGTSGTGAYPGYTVNAVMENRHRVLLGVGVEVVQGSASEKQGCLALLARAKRRLRFTPRTLGADKGFFHQAFIETLLARGIAPHIATETRGSAGAHARVRMRQRGLGYRLSQRCRKLIEELFGEGKDWHEPSGAGSHTRGRDPQRAQGRNLLHRFGGCPPNPCSVMSRAASWPITAAISLCSPPPLGTG